MVLIIYEELRLVKKALLCHSAAVSQETFERSDLAHQLCLLNKSLLVTVLLKLLSHPFTQASGDG